MKIEITKINKCSEYGWNRLQYSERMSKFICRITRRYKRIRIETDDIEHIGPKPDDDDKEYFLMIYHGNIIWVKNTYYNTLRLIRKATELKKEISNINPQVKINNKNTKSMIKEIIKVNSLPKGTAAVNGLGENLPETEPMMINVEKIESIIPPATTVEPGAFAMRYAGETIYVSNECFEELAHSWIDSSKTIDNSEKVLDEKIIKEIRETDRKINVGLLNSYRKRTNDPRPVTERIRTMTDVLDELGTDHPLVVQYVNITERGQQDEYLATVLQLRMLCEALNEGWHASAKPGEWRYWPWFCLYKSKEDAERYKLSYEENIEVPEAVRCVLFGGNANFGAYVGFAFADSSSAPSYAIAYVGSRLCFKSSELAMHAARHFHDLWLKYYFM